MREKTMQKHQFLKFIELKDRKIKREIEELFLKPIIVFIEDMDSFEIKEMKNTKLIKNTWDDWLNNWCMGEKKN